MSSQSPAPDVSDGHAEQPPPLLGTWRRMYAVVVVELAVTMILLYALAGWAS